MNKNNKIFIAGLLGFIIIILCITVVSFFLKDNANYAAFIGSILGTIISGIITFAVLFITIKQGNENQEKVLNVQSALQVEDNSLHFMEEQKDSITESVNKLDDLLFIVQILKVSDVKEMSAERKNLIKIFSGFFKAMNVIKLNTNIYIDTSKCDGCTDCDIKSKGDLSKRKTKLFECIRKIEYNCNMMFQELKEALDKSIDVQNLVAEKRIKEQNLLSYENLIHNYSLRNSNDDRTAEKIKQCEVECAKLQETIKSIDEKIQLVLRDIDEKNKKARSIANNIHMYDRNELQNAIMQYFDVYSFYVEEKKRFVLEHGILPISTCKKYTLK